MKATKLEKRIDKIVEIVLCLVLGLGYVGVKYYIKNHKSEGAASGLRRRGEDEEAGERGIATQLGCARRGADILAVTFAVVLGIVMGGAMRKAAFRTRQPLIATEKRRIVMPKAAGH